ncbi:hypothetical protein QI593_004650 [Salmonella enterica]|nr:hypothetical protein [Salmonella enterica]
MNKFEGIKLVHLESSDYVGEALSPTVEREIDTADIVIDGGKVVKNRVNQAEQRKLIEDSMGVYSAHLGESATKPYAIARVVNINIRNDVIGDGCFTRIVADTLIKYGEMIKSDNAGHHLPEFFDDDNGNRVTITGGRLSEEERLPSPAPRF